MGDNSPGEKRWLCLRGDSIVHKNNFFLKKYNVFSIIKKKFQALKKESAFIKCRVSHSKLELLSCKTFYKKKNRIKVVGFEGGHRIEATFFGSEALCGPYVPTMSKLIFSDRTIFFNVWKIIIVFFHNKMTLVDD